MKTLRTTFLAFTCLMFATSLVLTGCGDKTTTEDPPKTTTDDGEHDHDAHGHPTEGPHHGSLIELGNEEYHAELVHDEKAKTVTVYVLDSHGEKAVPIDAKKIVINLTHDGSAEQFDLNASPDEGDTEGQSSRFVSKDEELAEDLDKEDTKAKISIKVGEKQFTGDIKHEHEEGDHDHKGHSDKK